jgi:hypothetical protein
MIKHRKKVNEMIKKKFVRINAVSDNYRNGAAKDSAEIASLNRTVDHKNYFEFIL